MKPIENSVKTELFYVNLEEARLALCYKCALPLHEHECTVLMHIACWDDSSFGAQEQANRDLEYAIEHHLTTAQKGIGGEMTDDDIEEEE
jgi:hypothetical protein